MKGGGRGVPDGGDPYSDSVQELLPSVQSGALRFSGSSLMEVGSKILGVGQI